jgi:hypothetical protein
LDKEESPGEAMVITLTASSVLSRAKTDHDNEYDSEFSYAEDHRFPLLTINLDLLACLGFVLHWTCLV